MSTNNDSEWVPSLSDDEDFVTVSKDDFTDELPYMRVPGTGSAGPAETSSDGRTWIFFTDPLDGSQALPDEANGTDTSVRNRLRLRGQAPPHGGPLRAVYSGVKPFPPRLLVGKQAPLPYDAVPRLYLPLTDEPGIRDAVAAAPTMYGHILRRSPIRNKKLVGHKPAEESEVTESRRFYVTQYYTEMLRADFGRIEVEGSPWRSARLLARGEDIASSPRNDSNGHNVQDNVLPHATYH